MDKMEMVLCLLFAVSLYSVQVLGLPRVRMWRRTDGIASVSSCSPKKEPCPGRIVQIQLDIYVEHAIILGQRTQG